MSHSNPRHVPQSGKKSPAAFAAIALPYNLFAAGGIEDDPPGKRTPLTWAKIASTVEFEASYGMGTTRPPPDSILFTYEAARYWHWLEERGQRVLIFGWVKTPIMGIEFRANVEEQDANATRRTRRGGEVGCMLD